MPSRKMGESPRARARTLARAYTRTRLVATSLYVRSWNVLESFGHARDRAGAASPSAHAAWPSWVDRRYVAYTSMCMPETRTIAAAIVCYASCISPCSDAFRMCLGKLGLRRECRSDPSAATREWPASTNLPAIYQFPFFTDMPSLQYNERLRRPSLPRSTGEVWRESKIMISAPGICQTYPIYTSDAPEDVSTALHGSGEGSLCTQVHASCGSTL